MQVGARNGEWTQLMKPVVAKLTSEDLVNIVAYVSGRPVNGAANSTKNSTPLPPQLPSLGGWELGVGVLSVRYFPSFFRITFFSPSASVGRSAVKVTPFVFRMYATMSTYVSRGSEPGSSPGMVVRLCSSRLLAV